MFIPNPLICTNAFVTRRCPQQKAVFQMESCWSHAERVYNLPVQWHAASGQTDQNPHLAFLFMSTYHITSIEQFADHCPSSIIVFMFSFPGFSLLLNISSSGLILPEWISTDLLGQFFQIHFFLSNFITSLYATGLFSVLTVFITAHNLVPSFDLKSHKHAISALLFSFITTKTETLGWIFFVCFFRWLPTKVFV